MIIKHFAYTFESRICYFDLPKWKRRPTSIFLTGSAQRDPPHACEGLRRHIVPWYLLVGHLLPLLAQIQGQRSGSNVVHVRQGVEDLGQPLICLHVCSVVDRLNLGQVSASRCICLHASTEEAHGKWGASERRHDGKWSTRVYICACRGDMPSAEGRYAKLLLMPSYFSELLEAIFFLFCQNYMDAKLR